jgi:hypothetical protein
MLDLISICAESNVIAYFSDGKLQNLNIEITEAEQQECANLGRKILQRFASEIMADQVHSDSFRNKPETDKVPLVFDGTDGVLKDNTVDPNQMELPLNEEKPKRGRKTKGIEIKGIAPIDPKEQVITKETIDTTDIVGYLRTMPSAEGKITVATIETVLLTIDDLRTAVQEFISKNGKTEVAAQTAKLKTLFATYGGSDVSTFPKNKIAECIAKIQSL